MKPRRLIPPEGAAPHAHGLEQRAEHRVPVRPASARAPAGLPGEGLEAVGRVLAGVLRQDALALREVEALAQNIRRRRRNAFRMHLDPARPAVEQGDVAESVEAEAFLQLAFDAGDEALRALGLQIAEGRAGKEDDELACIGRLRRRLERALKLSGAGSTRRSG